LVASAIAGGHGPRSLTGNRLGSWASSHIDVVNLIRFIRV
jgi:hypothetical protein